MIETKQKEQKFILVGIETSPNDDCNDSLDELAELVKTSGGVCVGRIVQKLERQNPVTYIGKGKLEELSALIYAQDADGIVCDDELSPAQIRNMEQVLNCTILDRTLLILDIFAMRANSAEGKLQVELAQLKYRATRLVGLRNSLSRLGGGIGTRGPGEKKLEIDRRLIHDRIGTIKDELKYVEKNRETQRKKRQNSPLLSAMFVGYTNVGKSTLLNKLTNAGVLSENMLFATLDSTTRVLNYDSGEQILLTDTVGFIRKLPHDLVDAFKSTLEEINYADVIIHVVDCSSKTADLQMQVVKETLNDLKISGKTMITVFNKCDQLQEDEKPILRDLSADYSLYVSAKTGEGLDDLKDILLCISRNRQVYVEELISYKDAGFLQTIRKYGQLIGEEYTEDGIFVKAYLPKSLVKRDHNKDN